MPCPLASPRLSLGDRCSGSLSNIAQAVKVKVKEVQVVRCSKGSGSLDLQGFHFQHGHLQHCALEQLPGNPVQKENTQDPSSAFSIP